MKVNEKIREKILKDNDFSLGLAEIFSIKQVSVELLARRNSSKLTQYSAVQYYLENGFEIENVFETESETTS